MSPTFYHLIISEFSFFGDESKLVPIFLDERFKKMIDWDPF